MEKIILCLLLFALFNGRLILWRVGKTLTFSISFDSHPDSPLQGPEASS
jgi:hypothetical protein